MQKHINGYALALLELAKEENKLRKYKEQIIKVYKNLQENPKYIEILGSPVLEVKTKVELVKKAFDKKIEKHILNYMLILVERGLVNIIIPSLIKCKMYINESLNVHEGTIYSVDQLTSTQISKIEATTSKKLGLKVNLCNKLDAELISGIRVVVQDKVLDNSIDTQLKILKQELLEGRVK